MGIGRCMWLNKGNFTLNELPSIFPMRMIMESSMLVNVSAHSPSKILSVQWT